MAASLQDVPGWASDLLAEARLAHIGLLDGEDRPRVLPIAYALHEAALWTVVDSKPKRSGREPARLRFLRRNPRVAVTVDRYEEDWERLAWVQALGEAAVLEAGEHPAALAALAEKYEQYRSAPPPGPLIRVRPDRVLSWSAAGD